MKEILYIKLGQNTEVSKPDVYIGDIAQLECTNTEVLEKVKGIKLMELSPKKKRCVNSMLTVIELIHKEYPLLEIHTLGEADFIVTYRVPKERAKIVVCLKVLAVCLIIFCGAAFSIMAFNQDAGVTDIFKNIYKLVMGKEAEGFTILELMYSAGLVCGIIIFYNHIGKVNISKDPTPIEVEMRLYEEEINTTLIDNDGRQQEHSGR
ncbi:MAG: stage V sporulation protein AA [Lachnospiraceae bacterium]|nr:stage V sporulation protein AA [Lachnospiraceae bacterium]